MEAKPTLWNRLGSGRWEDRVGVTLGDERRNSEDSSGGFIESKGIRESVDDEVGGDCVRLRNESLNAVLEMLDIEFACESGESVCLIDSRVVLLARGEELSEALRSIKRRRVLSFSLSFERADELSCSDSFTISFCMVKDCKGNLHAAAKGEGAS